MHRRYSSAALSAALVAGLLISRGPLTSATESGAAVGQLPSDTEVAVVGRERVTLGQLPDEVRKVLQENRRRYDQQRLELEFAYRRGQQKAVEASANQFIDNQVAQLEAGQRATTVQTLLADIPPPPPVTSEDVRAFYDQQHLSQPFESVKDQIARHLKQQAEQKSRRAYLDGLRGTYSARLTLAPLRQQVAATGPVRGAMSATVTIVEFSDFQCPYCAKMHPVLEQLLASYPRDVRVFYRQYPLTDVHPDAMDAALAGVCAAEQGKFWEMHDAMFADQRALSRAALAKTAERIGIAVEPFGACIASDKAAQAVRADMQAAAAAGVTGTPGVFVNGRFYDGAKPYESIAAVVEEELARLRHGKPIRAASAQRLGQRGASN